MKLGFKFKAMTDVGVSRSVNQDSFAFITKKPRGCFIVADGMGGVKGGGTASSITIHSLIRDVEKRYDSSEELDQAYVKESVLRANKAILATGEQEQGLSGMGTTLCFLSFSSSGVIVSHIGDSRIYLLQDNVLHPITKDHTLIQELVDSGKLAENDAENHPVSHLLTRAMGQEDPLEPEFSELPVELKDGGRFLICSDGLTGHLDNEEIKRILVEGSVEVAAEALIEAANKAGGSDNITTVVIDYTPEDCGLREEKHIEFSSEEGKKYVESKEVQEVAVELGEVREAETELNEEDEDEDAEVVEKPEKRVLVKEEPILEEDVYVPPTGKSNEFISSVAKSFAFAFMVLGAFIVVLQVVKKDPVPQVAVEINEVPFETPEIDLSEDVLLGFKKFSEGHYPTEADLKEIEPLAAGIKSRAEFFLESEDEWLDIFPTTSEIEKLRRKNSLVASKSVTQDELSVALFALSSFRKLLDQPDYGSREALREEIGLQLDVASETQLGYGRTADRLVEKNLERLAVLRGLRKTYQADTSDVLLLVADEVAQFDPEVAAVMRSYKQADSQKDDAFTAFQNSRGQPDFPQKIATYRGAVETLDAVRDTLKMRVERTFTEGPKLIVKDTINLLLGAWHAKEEVALITRKSNVVSLFNFGSSQSNRKEEEDFATKLVLTYNNFLDFEERLPLKEELKFRKLELARDYGLPIEDLAP